MPQTAFGHARHIVTCLFSEMGKKFSFFLSANLLPYIWTKYI